MKVDWWAQTEPGTPWEVIEDRGSARRRILLEEHNLHCLFVLQEPRCWIDTDNGRVTMIYPDASAIFEMEVGNVTAMEKIQRRIQQKGLQDVETQDRAKFECIHAMGMALATTTSVVLMCTSLLTTAVCTCLEQIAELGTAELSDKSENHNDDDYIKKSVTGRGRGNTSGS